MKYQKTPTISRGPVINESAVGEDSQLIEKYMVEVASHYFKPLTRQWASPPLRFFNLKDEWEADTVVLSSITEICIHPAYQQIIGMGPMAIPLILNEMSQKQGHWFWALKAITGEDPVFPEQRGRMMEMTEAWLQWGSEQHYLQ